CARVGDRDVPTGIRTERLGTPISELPAATPGTTVCLPPPQISREGAMQDATARFGSVDWAAARHAACIVDANGGIVGQFSVEHTAAGLSRLVRQFQLEHVRRVAIERPDGPVVDALLAAELEVVVVSSRAVKALRT